MFVYTCIQRINYKTGSTKIENIDYKIIKIRHDKDSSGRLVTITVTTRITIVTRKIIAAQQVRLKKKVEDREFGECFMS